MRARCYFSGTYGSCNTDISNKENIDFYQCFALPARFSGLPVDKRCSFRKLVKQQQRNCRKLQEMPGLVPLVNFMENEIDGRMETVPKASDSTLAEADWGRAK